MRNVPGSGEGSVAVALGLCRVMVMRVSSVSCLAGCLAPAPQQWSSVVLLWLVAAASVSVCLAGSLGLPPVLGPSE